MAQEKLPDAFSNSMLIAGIDESVQLFGATFQSSAPVTLRALKFILEKNIN